MKIEIDQSGKVEQTSWPTVIAYSNGTSGALYMPAREKRLLLDYVRTASKRDLFPISIFAALIYILLSKFDLNKKIVLLDTEYLGHDETIRSFLTKRGLSSDYIRFGYIGKTSRAHAKAITCFRERKGMRVTAREVIEVLETK